MSKDDLHNKYRPEDFDEVAGQSQVVKSLKTLFAKGKVPHSLLFSGPSGTGKTTLARIIAKKLGCSVPVEIDAAGNRGIDNMKLLTESMQYSSLTGTNNIKFIIIDEAHELTREAMDALLKSLEEPPNHVYISLCTTELNKLPLTIRNRCAMYTLKELSLDDIADTLLYVAKEESIKVSEDAINLIAKESMGSMRQALQYLSVSRACKNVDQVAELLESPENSVEIKELCQFIAKGSKGGWSTALRILKGLKGYNPESIRISVANYLTTCVLEAKTEKQSLYFLDKLSCFSKPVYNRQAFHDIILNVADCVFGGDK
jgi:DNA polymerase-3 subunit gamma/tau